MVAVLAALKLVEATADVCLEQSCSGMNISAVVTAAMHLPYCVCSGCLELPVLATMQLFEFAEDEQCSMANASAVTMQHMTDDSAA